MTKTDLTKISDAELQAEIERRAKPQDKRSRSRSPSPRQLHAPDFGPLRLMIMETVAEAVRDGYWPKDHKQYIYEAAMEAVYGEAFWPWVNGIRWDGQ